MGELADRSSLRLAELLAVRLCHDLSSPLSTLMGALEMVNDDPGAAEEALPLAVEVSAILGTRLRLLRAAWGGPTPAMDGAELSAMLLGSQQGRKVRVDASALAPSGMFAPESARLALNVLMLAAEALPAGGEITLAGNPRREVVVAIAGPRAAWPAGLARYVADRTAAWSAIETSEGVEASRSLQAPLTALIADAAGIRLSLLMAPKVEAAPPLLMTIPI